MTKQKILIVEDEKNIAEVLIAYCQNNGFDVHHLDSGTNVVNYLKANTVDLMLLDLMLPDINGLDICKKIRLFSRLPIIMVTAKNEEIDRLLGLEFGADDYICKPFSPREVIARIKAVLRRVDVNENKKVIEQFDFIISLEEYTATFKGSCLDLTPIEFKVLALFLKNIDRVLTRDEILNQVYTDTIDISDRNIDTHIKNIRKKIHQVSINSNPIKSVYGIGYKCTQYD